jgi:hypothetical protein
VIVDQNADEELVTRLTAAAGDQWCIMREVKPGSAKGRHAIRLREVLSAAAIVVVLPFGATHPDRGGVWGPAELISKLMEGAPT